MLKFRGVCQEILERHLINGCRFISNYFTRLECNNCGQIDNGYDTHVHTTYHANPAYSFLWYNAYGKRYGMRIKLNLLQIQEVKMRPLCLASYLNYPGRYHFSNWYSLIRMGSDFRIMILILYLKITGYTIFNAEILRGNSIFYFKLTYKILRC